MPPPKTFKRFQRCMWFNEFGEPRVNPKKLEQGRTGRAALGCSFNEGRCNFVHPDDDNWLRAPFSSPPKPFHYKAGVVPPTPSPPPRASASLASRLRTPEREPAVKEEHMSPSISFGNIEPDTLDTRRRSHDSSRSSARDRDRSRDRERGRDRERDDDYERARHGDIRDREWERDRDRKKDRSRDRDRGWDRVYDRDRDHTLDRTQERWKAPRDPSSSNYEARRASLMDISERRRTASGDLSQSSFDRTPTQRPSIDMRRMGSTALSASGGERRTPSTPLFGREPTDFRDGARTPPYPPPVPPPPPPPPPADRFPSLAPPPPTGSSTLSSFSAGLPHPPDSAASAASFDSQQQFDQNAMPPPPTPTMVTPTSAVPVLPSFLSSAAEPEPRKEVLSLEERRKLWDKRIELLSNAVRARDAYKRHVADLKILRAVLAAPRNAGAPAAVREKMAASVQSAEKLVAAAKTRVDASLDKIYELDFWPVRKRPPAGDVRQEDGGGVNALWEEEADDLRRDVNDLDETVQRIDLRLKETTAFVKSLALGASTSASVTPVDQHSDTARGAKRRKVGDDGAYASDGGSTVVAGSVPPQSDALDTLDAVRLTRRIEALETNYADLDNLYTQTEHDRLEEVGNVIDARLEGWRSTFEADVHANQAGRLLQVEADVEQTGTDVSELAVTVSGLLNESSELNTWKANRIAENEQIAREREQVRALLDSERKKAEEMQAQIRANVEETAALNALVQRNAIPPPPPHVPSLDELVAALLPRLLDAVRDDLSARLAETRAELVQTVRGAAPQFELLRENVEKVQRLPEVLSLIERAGVNGAGAALAGISANGGGSGEKENQMANGHHPPR